MKMYFAFVTTVIVLLSYINNVHGVCCSKLVAKIQGGGFLNTGCNFWGCNCDGGCPLSQQQLSEHTPYIEMGDTLICSDVIKPGSGYIKSANGVYSAEMQSDGNFVIYQISTGTALWAANSGNGNGNSYIQFQADGNLVLYFKSCKSCSPVANWASNTVGVGHRAKLADDGKLYIYNANNAVVWHT